MKHRIKSVEEGSIASQLGLKSGDELLRVNGEGIVDFIDYQALCCSEKLSLSVLCSGEEIEFEFEKDEWEPLGIEFESDMLGKTRECVNHCRFCFVDQLPGGMRDSLRIKDDDWRLSLLMGNFVTLTNVNDAELERIIKRHASPLYISVHATDENIRRNLLRPRTNFDIMSQLRKLSAGGIQFHAQTVVCPGINDGKVLEDTIDDLSAMYPSCLSLAIVPVGLTGHREGLDDLKPFDRESAKNLLGMVNEKRKILLREKGTLFAFPSDEMYLIAGEPIPGDSEYEDYAQIDNGVGLVRQLITEYDDAYYELKPKYKKGGKALKHLCIACGTSIQPILQTLMDDHPISGVDVKVCAVKNRFFGESVTVSGLITGRDLIYRMKKEKCDAVLITECMLRSGEETFLDDMTLSQVKKELGVNVVPVGRTGEDLLSAVLAFSDKG